MAGVCCKGKPMEQRKRPRLVNYDYSAPGMYFVTICTENRRNLLSKVCRGDPCGRPSVVLLPLGEIAEQVFEKVEKLYGVEFDCHVIMPNHIHFIVCLSGKRATVPKGTSFASQGSPLRWEMWWERINPLRQMNGEDIVRKIRSLPEHLGRETIMSM